MKEDILNKKQAARYLKISIPTLDRLMKAKKIPYVKLNSRVLFLREGLLDWLKNKQAFISPDEPGNKRILDRDRRGAYAGRRKEVARLRRADPSLQRPLEARKKELAQIRLKARRAAKEALTQPKKAERERRKRARAKN